uniref:Chromatin assembly factor 1, subunit A (p150) n=1 Tax=Cyclopterus lumpus TaxID=8103 RepID=A0A8C2X6J1_CYCLU
MDCKSSNNANKKLIQARLPFKRMNPEPKENQPPKRPCAHACPKAGVPDRENEIESSPLPVHSGRPLVNGRGPLDGFLSRRRTEPSDENMVIDLTSDNTMSPAKRTVSPTVASPCLQAKDKHQDKDKTASSGKTVSVDHNPKTHTLDCTVDSDNEEGEDDEEEEEEEEVEEEEEEEEGGNQTASNSQLDSTQNSESEPEEQDESGNTLAAACGKFAPFEIKEHMALAPLCRVQCEDAVLEELDRCLLNPADNLNGLRDWIGPKPRRSGPTNPRQRDSECTTTEGPKPDGVPDRTQCGPMKLLQFHANYRPAYWGTWSKKSSHISPRCPLKRDKVRLFLFGVLVSDGEDDDDDDGFFVPHGYLSDDEGAPEEEVGGDLEKQKLRQKVKAKEWDELMSTKKRMKVLDPVVRGCVWEGEGPAGGLQLFRPYALCLVVPLPKADTSPSPEEFSRKLLGQLLPLLHGNRNSSKVIITEFQEFCRQQTSTSSSSPPDLIQVKRLIKSNAVYEKRSTHRRCCWYVHTEVLSHCGQEALPVPCHWTYLTTGAREESREEPQAATGSQGNSPTTPQTSSSTASSSSNKRKSTGSMSITKFMKKCTDREQTEAMEADGFQADNEEDDEEDCVIVATQSGEFTLR